MTLLVLVLFEERRLRAREVLVEARHGVLLQPLHVVLQVVGVAPKRLQSPLLGKFISTPVVVGVGEVGDVALAQVQHAVHELLDAQRGLRHAARGHVQRRHRQRRSVHVEQHQPAVRGRVVRLQVRVAHFVSHASSSSRVLQALSVGVVVERDDRAAEALVLVQLAPRLGAGVVQDLHAHPGRELLHRVRFQIPLPDLHLRALEHRLLGGVRDGNRRLVEQRREHVHAHVEPRHHSLRLVRQREDLVRLGQLALRALQALAQRRRAVSQLRLIRKSLN